MRPRIKPDRSPKIVYTTSKDKTMRDLAKFNREQDKKKYNIEYVLCMFGKVPLWSCLVLDFCLMGVFKIKGSI